MICESVCDDCNRSFGERTKGRKVSVEEAFKEGLNLSRFAFFYAMRDMHFERYKGQLRKSQFFNIHLKSGRIDLKPKFRIIKHFEDDLGRQFRRGIYKVFLEERQRLVGNSLKEEYDFIRYFSRYDLNDCSLYIKLPKRAFAMSTTHDQPPQLNFSDHQTDIMNQYRHYEFMLFGHFFVLECSNQAHLFFEEYKRNQCAPGNPWPYLKKVIKFRDVDFAFSYLNKG